MVDFARRTRPFRNMPPGGREVPGSALLPNGSNGLLLFLPFPGQRFTLKPPTINPLRSESLPLRFRFQNIRSMLYKYSPVSSTNKIFPVVIRSEADPAMVSNVFRFPPTSIASALPPLLQPFGVATYFIFTPASASRMELIVSTCIGSAFAQSSGKLLHILE